MRDVVKTLWEALGSLREALGSPLGEALGDFGEPEKLYNNKAELPINRRPILV